MTRTLWIPMPMPNLNDLLAAALSHRTVYGKLKRKWGGVVSLYARSQGFAAIDGPAHFEIEFVEPNRRRDPDGLVAGGTKIVFDALQEAGLLANDGWEHVLSILPTWRVDKAAPGVRLTVREATKANPVSVGALPGPVTKPAGTGGATNAR